MSAFTTTPGVVKVVKVMINIRAKIVALYN